MRKLGSIVRRGKRSWRIRYSTPDGRQAETIKGDREFAESELAQRIADIKKGIPVSSRPNTVLFGELAADVISDYRVNHFRSIDDAEARIRLHLEPAFGKRKAAQITTSQIRRYITRRQEAGAKTGTINRELELMRHIFTLAMREGNLLRMPHVPMLREDNVRAGFFTREEVDRLCACLQEPIASMVRFAFLTGWRLEEIRSLQWASVDFQAGEIRLDAGKTKSREGRVFPMTEELRELLLKLASPTVAKVTAIDAGSGHANNAKPMPANRVTAFTHPVFVIDGRPVGEFRKTWKTANHKAGLPCIYDINGKLVRAVRIFHDLRRSAAKNLIAQGIPERVVMQMCGWKTRSVFDRYSIVGEADLKAAREKMDGFGASLGANSTAKMRGSQ